MTAVRQGDGPGVVPGPSRVEGGSRRWVEPRPPPLVAGVAGTIAGGAVGGAQREDRALAAVVAGLAGDGLLGNGELAGGPCHGITSASSAAQRTSASRLSLTPGSTGRFRRRAVRMAVPTPFARSATWARRSRRAAVGSFLAKGILLGPAPGCYSTAGALPLTGLNGSLLATVAGRGAAAGLRRQRQAAGAAAGAAALATTTASSAVARCRGSARPAPPATPPATNC
jgi:hypothetical protein